MEGMVIYMSNQNTAGRKRKKDKFPTGLKVIIWIVVIAAVIFLTLIVSYRIAGFDSLADMLSFILGSR